MKALAVWGLPREARYQGQMGWWEPTVEGAVRPSWGRTEIEFELTSCQCHPESCSGRARRGRPCTRDYGWEIREQHIELKQALDEYIDIVRARRSEDSHGKGNGKG